MDLMKYRGNDLFSSEEDYRRASACLQGQCNRLKAPDQIQIGGYLFMLSSHRSRREISLLYSKGKCETYARNAADNNLISISPLARSAGFRGLLGYE